MKHKQLLLLPAFPVLQGRLFALAYTAQLLKKALPELAFRSFCFLQIGGPQAPA